MRIEVGIGTLGVSDTSWGTAPDGAPVMLVRTPEATLRLVFTPEEAREHGAAAIYLAMSALLSRTARPSPLVGIDGGPLG